jgi:hypothetical protein
MARRQTTRPRQPVHAARRDRLLCRPAGAAHGVVKGGRKTTRDSPWSPLRFAHAAINGPVYTSPQVTGQQVVRRGPAESWSTPVGGAPRRAPAPAGDGPGRSSLRFRLIAARSPSRGVAGHARPRPEEPEWRRPAWAGSAQPGHRRWRTDAAGCRGAAPSASADVSGRASPARGQGLVRLAPRDGPYRRPAPRSPPATYSRSAGPTYTWRGR